MCRSIALTLLGLFMTTSIVEAQPAPHPFHAPSPNFERAYRYYLNSPATMKEFSTSRPGIFSDTYTPFSRETFYLEPDYYRERVTPYSFETQEYVPGYSGTLDTPYTSEGYRVPGYERTYVQPLPSLQHMPPLRGR